MSRLIDADATKRRVADTFFDTLIPCVNRALDDSPTIDAVPVVRSMECTDDGVRNELERKYLVEAIVICTSPDATDECLNAVWPDHFCSY